MSGAFIKGSIAYAICIAVALVSPTAGCRPTTTRPVPFDAGVDGVVDALDEFNTGPNLDATVSNVFGAYNYTIEHLAPSEQQALLKAIGYEGMVTAWMGEPKHRGFIGDMIEGEAHLAVTASIMELNIDAPVDRVSWSTTLKALKVSQTLPWVLVSGAQTSVQAIADRVGEVADLADQLGTSLILYPHWAFAIETAEESVEVIRRAGRTNVKTSLHLCHELKAGNRDRLAEVITLTGPYLSLVSINGAYTTGYEEEGWDRTITPLDEGDFNVQGTYLRPLLESGYDGPILLHTFGITAPFQEHYARSFATYSQMLVALGLSLQ